MTDIFDQARAAVDGERQKQYGDPEEHWDTVAAMWQNYIATILERDDDHLEITPADAALMMVLMKLAREAHAHKADNLVDAAGYLLLASRLAEGDAGAAGAADGKRDCRYQPGATACPFPNRMCGACEYWK